MSEPTTPCAPVLEPCPFCGAEGENLGTFGEPDLIECSARRIQCFGCNVEAPFYPSEEEAIAAWNRRTPPQPDRAVMQQALDALEAITRHFGIVRLGESRLADTNVRCEAHAAMAALRAALSATKGSAHGK